MKTTILAAILAALLPFAGSVAAQPPGYGPYGPWQPPGWGSYPGPDNGLPLFAPPNVWSPGDYLPLASFSSFRVSCTSNTPTNVLGRIGYVGTDGQWHVETFQANPITIHTGNMAGVQAIVNVKGLGGPSGSEVYIEPAFLP